MDYLSTFSSLTDILHAFAQALLVPDILMLLLFAGYAIFSIGSIVMEYFTERRNFKVAMPEFLAALMSADEQTIPEVIRSSQLLNRQKSALLTVFDYRTLPGDALLGLIRRLVNTEETRYDRISGRNNTAAKISPMLGLMGTLIPLGPGVAALGQNDVSVLSSSLLIAFDTTVAGLVVAAICLAIGKIRGNWYNDYLSALDSSMATMLQKIEDMRAAGTIVAKEPTNYSFLFEEGLKTPSAKAPEEKKETTPSASPMQGSPATSPTPHVAAPNDARVAPGSLPTSGQARTSAGSLQRQAPTSASPTQTQAPAGTPPTKVPAPASTTSTHVQTPASTSPAQGQTTINPRPTNLGQ